MLKRALRLWASGPVRLSEERGKCFRTRSRVPGPIEESNEVVVLFIRLLIAVLREELPVEDTAVLENFDVRAEVARIGNSTPAIGKEAANRPQRSILKTTRTSTSIRKTVRICDTALVSPSKLSITNPSLFSPASPSSSTMPQYIPHTSSSAYRTRHSFDRRSPWSYAALALGVPAYISGRWASPADHKKANTSWMAVLPKVMERRARRDEQERVREEWMANALRAIAGRWVRRIFVGVEEE